MTKLHERENYLVNYKGHITTISNNNPGCTYRSNLVVASKHIFNPNGDWLSAKGMQRWIKTYVKPESQLRISAWVDTVLKH